MCRSWFIFEAWAEDKPPAGLPLPPISYEIPQAEAWKWRAMEAEAMAARLQASQVLAEKIRVQQDMVREWKLRFGLEDLEGFQIDAEKGLLRKD